VLLAYVADGSGEHPAKVDVTARVDVEHVITHHTFIGPRVRMRVVQVGFEYFQLVLIVPN